MDKQKSQLTRVSSDPDVSLRKYRGSTVKHAQMPAMVSANMTPSATSFENTMKNITDVFTNSLTQIVKGQQKCNKYIPHYFHGLDHEDPQQFVDQLYSYFEENEIRDESEKLNIATQLRDAAAKWYEPYRQLAISYDSFTERLIYKFNSTSIITAAKARLYGEKQKEGEPAEIFLTNKPSLYMRLERQEPDILALKMFLDQLLPEIRSRIRSVEFQNIEELIQMSTQIETDLNEIPRYRRPNENIARNRNASSPMSNRNYYDTNHRNNYTIPPSPCKYCGLWHYHKDCPQNPYRQQTSSGNSQRAGERTTTPATSQPAPSTSH